MTVSPRYGTAVTDSFYITSRDGKNFRQSNDVFLRPGLRTRHNWSYGDNYIAWHVVETESTKDDSPRELSLYATESYFTGTRLAAAPLFAADRRLRLRSRQAARRANSRPSRSPSPARSCR